MKKQANVMTGYRLYHSKLVAAGKLEAAAAYAVRRNLMVDRVVGAVGTADVAQGTPGGEGVAVAEGASNWDSSTPPLKNLAKELTSDTSTGIATVAEPILATLRGDPGPTHTQVAVEELEAVRENVGGIARERCPDGVYWAQVTSDQVNRLRKNIRLHPSGEEGLLHVSYRLCARRGDRLKFEWFPVTHSREPGQEKDWVVFQGTMIP